MPVDIVVVAYRSSTHLRGCVEPLCDEPDLTVIVVDNACPEHSVSTVEDLPIRIVEMGRNAGFGAGCNAGARAGSGEAVLFLNPDARVSAEHVRTLAAVLASDPSCGAVGPRILEATGETQPSMRRGPSLLTAFAEALFVHHAVRGSDWPTEIVRRGYEKPRTDPSWLTGAALCVRRSAFEQLGGFDERFFMYSEDTDLGVRLRHAGFVLRYEPAAVAVHEGGASTLPPEQAPMRAEARVAYARLHERGFRYLAFRFAFALYELLRIPVAATRSWTHVRARMTALGTVVYQRRRSLSGS
jgi:N-acetylglucosaminyl-diphospho-decaprenol L-rhamnosyltransferase